MRANRILAMHHVKAENIFMLEGSVAYRTGHCLSVVHGGIVVGWIDQGSIQRSGTNTQTSGHGFTAEAFPSGRQGLLDPPSVSEDGCPWRWFTNAFKEVNRGGQ